ncbi:MAG TPA: ASCH domain-containing protein [Pyrinomonadaceae bacterium]|nr:ASCH domain-containing protein [Pyrinomonadaceae bacterium]
MRIHERKMKFGGEGDGGLGDGLVRQILDGAKTATCELKAFCTEREVADLDAEPGWFETVLDAAGRPRCNVRVRAVYETTFGSPDARLVRGEGCEDVDEFKRGHGRWFNALLKEKGLPPLTDDSVLVVWEFELVETA